MQHGFPNKANLSVHEKVLYDFDHYNYKTMQRASTTKHRLSEHKEVKFICDQCEYMHKQYEHDGRK